jgi:hypothetical protein
MYLKNSFLSLLLFSCTTTLALSQTVLQNPSFEDEPSDAIIPHGWFMCSEGTTPDILPGFWGVDQKASEGNTYMGIISRPDGSYESIGQRLLPALEKGDCYAFSLDVAYSRAYAGYNQPIQLRVYLASSKCKREQLIYESKTISHKRWKKLKVEFTPEKEMKYIIIEAYAPSTTRGNVLLDNMSDIRSCSRA